MDPFFVVVVYYVKLIYGLAFNPGYQPIHFMNNSNVNLVFEKPSYTKPKLVAMEITFFLKNKFTYNGFSYVRMMPSYLHTSNACRQTFVARIDMAIGFCPIPKS